MESFTLRLSQDELALLLEALDITHLGGSPVAAMQPLAPDQAVLVRPAVQRGLLARGLVLPMVDGSLAIDGALQRLLRLCAYPDAALLITSRSGDSELRQQEAYFRLGELTVRHTMPLDGVHELTLLAEMPDIASAVVAWLGERTAEVVQPALRLTLSPEVLEQAQAAANQGQAAMAQARLVESGAPANAAGWLASALTNPTARLLAVVLSPHLTGAPSALTLLCDRQRCWSVATQDGPPPSIALETVDVATVSASLRELVELWSTPAEEGSAPGG